MPAVYVGTYAKYNNGSIFGEWVDLEVYDDKDAFYEKCRAIHDDEEDPEMMFQDWEDVPADMVSECHISEELWEWLDLDDDDRKLLAVYREHVDQSGTIEQAQENYAGTYSSREDWAENWWEETGLLEGIPESARYYIDYSAYARDAAMGGDMVFAEVRYQEVWAFHNR